MAVTLKNNTRRMQVINLDHSVVCSEDDCRCTRQRTGIQAHDPRTGEKTVRAFNRRLPGSITLTAKGSDGDTVAGLPDGVARLPTVQLLKGRGELAIELETEEVLAARKADAEEAKKRQADYAAAVKKSAEAAPKKTASAGTTTAPAGAAKE